MHTDFIAAIEATIVVRDAPILPETR
jgi:hypothetical protein